MRQRLIAPLLLSEGTRHTVAKSTWSFRPWRVRFLFFFFFVGGGGGVWVQCRFIKVNSKPYDTP